MGLNELETDRELLGKDKKEVGLQTYTTKMRVRLAVVKSFVINYALILRHL